MRGKDEPPAVPDAPVDPPVAIQAPPQRKRHREVLDAYFKANWDEWSKSSRAKYTMFRERQEKYFGAGIPLDDIKVERVVSYVQWMQRHQKLSPRSISDRLAFGRRVFGWALDMEWVQRNPFRVVKPPKPAPVREARPFSPEEVQRILTTAREKFPWTFPCIVVAAITGCRRHAIRMLNVGDFDPTTGVLRVRPEIAKMRRGHEYALPLSVQAILAEAVKGRKPTDPLFRSRLRNRYSEKAFDVYVGENQYPNVWRRVLDAAGVEPRGIHQLRSAVDSNLVGAGVSLDLATGVTGHTQEVARKHYLRIHRDALRGTMSTLAAIYGVTEKGQQNGRSASSTKKFISVNLEQAEAAQLASWIGRDANLPDDSGADSGASRLYSDAECCQCLGYGKMAERGGFEPPIQLEGRMTV